MTGPAENDDVLDLLVADALDTLAPAEKQRLDALLAADPRLALMAVRLRETAGELASLAPLTRLAADRNAQLRQRILAATAGSPGQGGAWARTGLAGDDNAARKELLKARRLAAAGWLAAAGMSSLVLVHHTAHKPLGTIWVVAAIAGIAAGSLMLGWQIVRGA